AAPLPLPPFPPRRSSDLSRISPVGSPTTGSTSMTTGKARMAIGLATAMAAALAMLPAAPATAQRAEAGAPAAGAAPDPAWILARSEEHTSELQSRENLVC